jgi:uncharacterized protein (TIGR02996 family)
MTMEEAFLGDIAADRFNAAVRLIYADWLLEQGREDESYAWRWATARGRYPFVSPHANDVWWCCCDMVSAMHAALPRHAWWALKPRPRTLRQRYSCAGVPWAFGALAQALRRLRNEVAIR